MKYLMIVFFGLLTITTKAQIQTVKLPDITKIGEVKYMGQFLAELHYIATGNDTTYSLLFDNQKYTSISDLERVEFQNSPGILDTLYNLLNKGFDLEKGKHSTFYLGKDFVSITSDKAMGMKFIQVMALDKKAYFYLRKKQLNELFGKGGQK